ncbi:hypothetical protein [Microcoleus sp. PH2017_22_RUC_O_B]|nr:hypothetical protein [Microcoleus sp. PH2017_22_RUC_O_B]
MSATSTDVKEVGINSPTPYINKKVSFGTKAVIFDYSPPDDIA